MPSEASGNPKACHGEPVQNLSEAGFGLPDGLLSVHVENCGAYPYGDADITGVSGRAVIVNEPDNSDLGQRINTTESGTEYRLLDKLAAIKSDCDLAGEGSEARGNDALEMFLKRVAQ